MPGSFRVWRWLSALSLLAVGLVVGASAAGAQAPASGAAATHISSMPAQIHTNPGHFLHGPHPHVVGHTEVDVSTNWSGQIATGTTFTSVSANWAVPTIQPTQYEGAAATWVGIDGGPDSPDSIIQAGTAQITEDGLTSYTAWYELYPDPPVTIGDVAPGDSMTVDIAKGSGSAWLIEVDDNTQNSNRGINVPYSGPAASAEWIEELPTAVGSTQPTLANFGSATFTDMRYVASGAPSLTPIWMVDESGNLIATAGPYSGTISFPSSFTDTYVPPQRGYWLVGSDGGIFSFGAAQFYGSTGSLSLDKPIVGMASTIDGNGYWLVASDGGIFAFGDAGFFGSTGGLPLQKPIVGMASAPDGGGYWLVASDGGIFNFGDVGYFGSAGGAPIGAPMVGMTRTADGQGYWMIGRDGGIFNYGDAGFYGSVGGTRLNRPIVGMAAIQSLGGGTA